MKRRVLSLALALALCLGLSSGLSARAAGTVQIASAEELEEFVRRVDFEDEKDLDAVLTADIDLTGRDWLPIALESHGRPYTGTFDGNGHKISNLSREWHGFMGQLGAGGAIRDLTLENINITNGNYGLVEKCSGTISNCNISGTINVSSGSYTIGGIAAEVEGGSITGCRSSVRMVYDAHSIAAFFQLGGIAGVIGGTPSPAAMGILDRCVFDGSIAVSGQANDCSSETGGIVGAAGMYGLVTNCANYGDITVDITAKTAGNTAQIGGITGWTAHGYTTNCMNTGDITVTARGINLRCSGLGLAALHGDGPACATNSYSTGKVTIHADSASTVGAIDGKGEMLHSMYFLEGMDLNRGETVTFTQAELLDGTLAGRLNQHEYEDDALRRFVDGFNETYGGAVPCPELCSWVQGSQGPELSDPRTPAATPSAPAAPSTPAPNASGFADVPESQYYYGPVVWAVQWGIAGGTGPNAFSPEKTCTKADILTFLWRAMGQPEPLTPFNPFPDSKVSETDYYYKPLLWAWDTGAIAEGESFDFALFDPKAPCTRLTAVFYIWASLGYPVFTAAESQFKDLDLDSFRSTAVIWAVDAGVTGGTGADTFSPERTCTRGEIVTFLYRAIGQ